MSEVDSFFFKNDVSDLYPKSDIAEEQEDEPA